MSVLEFIQVHFWILLAMCGVVGALGIALWVIGTVLYWQGMNRLRAHDKHEAEMAQIYGPSAEDSEGPLYPPVENYDEISDEEIRLSA